MVVKWGPLFIVHSREDLKMYDLYTTLQKHHFLLSYFNALAVGPGFGFTTFDAQPKLMSQPVGVLCLVL